MDVLYVCRALLWCVIDDNNVAVLLHSVIHDFVLESIFVSEYWNCTINGLLSKGCFHHSEHMDVCAWRETNLHPCSLKFWDNEIEVRTAASSAGKNQECVWLYKLLSDYFQLYAIAPIQIRYGNTLFTKNFLMNKSAITQYWFTFHLFSYTCSM